MSDRRLATATDRELHLMLVYERDIESKRDSPQRVERSLKKIARIKAELARRQAQVSP